MNIARILGNFFFTTPERDDIIIVSPFIKDDFYLEVPLIEMDKCNVSINKIHFIDAINIVLECLNVKIHVFTRERSKRIFKKYGLDRRLRLRVIPNLHAKMFVNSKFIIITSANLFYKSLYLNYEIIEIKENEYSNPFLVLKEYLPRIPN